MAQCHNPFLLTLPELMSAKKKIGRAAAFYDRDKMSLSGFDSHSLSPSEFRSQLRSNFLIEMTNAELGAIIMLFDKDGDGTVDTVEFINEFFRLGKAERMKHALHRKDAEATKARHIEKQKRIKQEKVEILKKTATANSFSPEDEESAIRKITKVAFTYDNTKPTLKEFALCSTMTGPEFRELMKRNFQVMLTPREVAALIHLFDETQNSSDGTIDTRLFVYHFFRMGRSERDRYFHKHLHVTHVKKEKHKKRLQDIKDKFGQLIVAKVSKATDADRVSAEKKIRQAAAYFTRDKAFPVNIEKCFESLDLTPTDFKAILKNNFYIELSPGELDAVMTMFDTDGDGSISCVEFLTTFFMMGSREKSRVLEMHRQEDERRHQAEMDRIQRKIDAIEALNRTKVVWPVLPPNEDELMSPLESTAPSGAVTPMRRQSSLPDINAGASGAGTSEEGSPKIRLRKPSVTDLVAPSKTALRLLRNDKSLTRLYPKASQDTKDFILEIEEQERQIKETTTLKKKKKRRSSGSKNPSPAASPGPTPLNKMGSAKFNPNLSHFEEEEEGSMGAGEGGLADPNNWGTNGVFPDETGRYSSDRCDSRGGTRSGVARIPTVNTKPDDNEYDDSEFG